MDEPKEPTTQAMGMEEVQAQLNHLLDDVSNWRTRVVVERDGAPMAALVSMRDLEDVRFAWKQRREMRAALEGMWEAFKDVDPATIEQEVAAAVAQVRAEMRKERRRNAEER
jgi:PHD/YefM family antitoxin component YafN of YafNO toxin-antitoxin module